MVVYGIKQENGYVLINTRALGYIRPLPTYVSSARQWKSLSVVLLTPGAHNPKGRSIKLVYVC